jgi:hypothetical protein
VNRLRGVVVPKEVEVAGIRVECFMGHRPHARDIKETMMLEIRCIDNVLNKQFLLTQTASIHKYNPITHTNAILS